MQIDRTPSKAKPISLTPLIDVVFLLIVFFMVTTSFIDIEAIELNLPPLSESEAKQTTFNKSKILVVDIADSGKIYLNQKLVSQDDLHGKLRRKIKVRRNKKIIVRAAKRVSVQKLVMIMDAVHLVGGRDIAIAEWDGYVRPLPSSFPLESVYVPEVPVVVLPDRRPVAPQSTSAPQTLDEMFKMLEERK